jgi:hypothetical protein
MKYIVNKDGTVDFTGLREENLSEVQRNKNGNRTVLNKWVDLEDGSTVHILHYTALLSATVGSGAFFMPIDRHIGGYTPSGRTGTHIVDCMPQLHFPIFHCCGSATQQIK